VRIFLLNLYICFIFNSCNNGISSDEPNVVYSNSFETERDTCGWQGLFTAMFVNDPAPYSGYKSLHIGGGCIQPAASFEFPRNLPHGKYKMTCWAKLGHNGGGISLTEGNQRYQESGLGPKDSAWAYYESKVPFSFSGNSNLKIEIFVGGIIPADIFLDNLKVIRLE
jgi:hypothetical protein